MMRRRRPIFTVLTRPVLIRLHMVVLPTPMSLQAIFTGTASGLIPGASTESAALEMGIRFAFFWTSTGACESHD
jgi:hypothetical protein